LADIRNSLKSLMWRAAAIRRDGERLTEAAEKIEHWCRYVLVRQFKDPTGWELQNMLIVARIMIRAALDREESRGVHLRTDFPETDEVHWCHHQVFSRREDERPENT
jgi:L-aspartate oxidase